MDATRYRDAPAAAGLLLAQDHLEEFSMPPAVFTEAPSPSWSPCRGRAPPLPGAIGLRHPMFTIHSEVATLPLSYAGKGIRR